ncbi:MAG: hypothetical protein ACM37W_12040 [Actinomycetota bacterium]
MKKSHHWVKSSQMIALLSFSLLGIKATSAAEVLNQQPTLTGEATILAQSCNSEFRMVMTPEGGPINVRDRSNIDGKVIASIPNRSVVLFKRLNDSGDWANIITNRGQGFEGWVWANYLSCGAD